MIQDISPSVFHNQYMDLVPEDDDIVLAFNGRYILLHEDGERFCCPKVSDLLAAGGNKDDLQYLFAVDDNRFFLYRPTKELLLDGYSYDSLTFLRKAEPRSMAFAGETAYHLYVWYRDNKFCGRCGAQTEHAAEMRALKCPHCGNIIFPKIAPAIIVGITDGDKIVITRYAGREYKGMSLVAGFCEIGETAEDTIRREAMEEVGLKVKNIRYYKSQPWGFDQNLLIGYFCEVDGSRKIVREEDELAVAEWVSREDITDEMGKTSMTAEMIEYFRVNGF